MKTDKRKCEGKIYDQSIEYHWYSCSNDAKHVHHKDRNHFNNDPNNLMFLCPSCYSKEHAEDENSPGNRLRDLVDDSNISFIHYNAKQNKF